MLSLDGYGSILDHKPKMVQGNSNDEDWHIISDRACFKQVDGEVEDVVILRLVQLLGEDELVDLAHFWIQNCAVRVLDNRASLVLSHMEENLANQNSSVEHGWEIVRKVSRIVLLRSDPILDEACRLRV